MTERIYNQKYGDIVYTENFWSGRKTLNINGVEAIKTSKKSFSVDGKIVTVLGSYVTGVRLIIDGECVEVIKKPTWYEIVLALIPFVMNFVLIGGAVGGFLGALSGMLSILFMRKTGNIAYKVLITIAALAVSLVVGFVIALLVVALLY